MKRWGWILLALVATILMSQLPASPAPGDRVAYPTRPMHDRLSSSVHGKFSTSMILATYSTNGRMSKEDKYKLDFGPLSYGLPTVPSPILLIAPNNLSKYMAASDVRFQNSTTASRALMAVEKKFNHNAAVDEGVALFQSQKTGGTAYNYTLTGYILNTGGTGMTVGSHGKGITNHDNGQVWGMNGFALSPYGGGFSQLTGGEFNVMHNYSTSGKYGKNYAQYRALSNFNGGAYGVTIATDQMTGTGTAAVRITRNMNGAEFTDGKWRTAILVEPDTVSDWDSGESVNEIFKIYGNKGDDGGVGTGPRLFHADGLFTSGIVLSDATFTGANPTAVAIGSANRYSGGRLLLSGSTLANIPILNVTGSPVWSSNGSFASSVQPTPTISGDQSLSEFHGLIFNPQINSGTSNIARVNGIYARVDTNSGYSGNITESNGFTVRDPIKGGAGTIGTNTGLFIADMTAGTTNYSIVTGSAPSKFGGLVESTSGGFKFPDGTTMTTAAVTNSSSGVSNVVQLSNGSGGFTSNSAIYRAQVGADQTIRADNFYAGNPGAGGKDLITAYDTATSALSTANTVNTRIPAPGAAGYVPFGVAGTPTTYSTDAAFFWDNTNKRLGIGTTSPGTAIDVSGTTAPNSRVRITNTAASASNGGGAVYIYQDDGAAVASGDRIGYFLMGGSRDASHTLSIGAYIAGYAAENWSSTSAATDVAILTTNSGATAPNERIRIASNGLVTNSNGGGVPFGHQYSNTSTTVSVASANTWYEMTTNMTAGQLKNVTHGGSHYLVATTAGYYKIDTCAAVGTSAAGDEVALSVLVNGTSSATSHGHATVITATTTSSICSTTILSLAANDQISLGVENHAAGRDITISHAQQSMVYIGSP